MLFTNDSSWLAILSVFISIVKRNRIVPEENRPKVCRPARTIQGEYGPIEVPDTGDGEACDFYAVEQVHLAFKAARAHNEGRERHHRVNTYFIQEDPMTALFDGQAVLELPRCQFFKTVRLLEIYLHYGRTVNGAYGPIDIPDPGDREACNAFAIAQGRLSLQAAAKQDEIRMMYHVANAFLILEDPVAALDENRGPLSLLAYQFIRRHIDMYLYNLP